jgi:hypothetical protein
VQLDFIYLFILRVLIILLYRPKIQRLVTPIRLQRRRHLLSLKRRRLEHQKEQKSEYEYVVHPFPLLFHQSNIHLTVLSSPNVSQRKRQRPQRSRRRTKHMHDWLAFHFYCGAQLSGRQALAHWAFGVSVRLVCRLSHVNRPYCYVFMLCNIIGIDLYELTCACNYLFFFQTRRIVG